MPALPDDFPHADFDSLAPGGGPTQRRDFLAGVIAGGFALAVRPVTAQTLIHTDETGIVTGSLNIPAADTVLPAYHARPADDGPFPVVVVVQEIFGVHAWIRDICRRLAHAGYLAIAPSLYVRQGDPSTVASIPEIMQTIVSRVPDAQVMSDLDATFAWATHHGGNAKRLAITGFCWGGRIVWLYAAHSATLRAGVAWYGRLGGAASPLTPEHPLDLAARLKAPVLGLYGGKDQGIPVESVDRMRKALAAAHAPSELVVFPEAQHGFLADYRPSYDKAASEDGWKRLLAWFKTHGV